MTQLDKRQALATTAFCKELASDVLDEMAAVGETRQFEPGQTVVAAGDDADGLYLIMHGSAHVDNAFAGEKKTVGKLNEHDVFGEVALLGSLKRASSVIADEPLSCVVLPTEPMKAVMARHPEIKEHLENLGQRRITTNLELHLGELPEIED